MYKGADGSCVYLQTYKKCLIIISHSQVRFVRPLRTRNHVSCSRVLGLTDQSLLASD